MMNPVIVHFYFHSKWLKETFVPSCYLGIGRTLALKLYEMEAEVYGITRTESDLKSLKEECPNMKTFCQDISKWDELKKLVESLPVMDGLVNNAGINILEPIVDITEDHLDQ